MSFVIASLILSGALIVRSIPRNEGPNRQPGQQTWQNESKGGGVFGEWLRRLLGHHFTVHHDMTMIDARLERMEHRQREIDARLSLLERQADIRGYTAEGQ
jgi:hypothetical protein